MGKTNAKKPAAKRKKPGPKPGPLHDLTRNERRKLAKAQEEERQREEALVARCRRVIEALREEGAVHAAALAGAALSWAAFHDVLRRHADLKEEYDAACATRTDKWYNDEDELLHLWAVEGVEEPELAKNGRVVLLKRRNVNALLRLYDQRHAAPRSGDADAGALSAFQAALRLRAAVQGAASSTTPATPAAP